jgi:hypothetical protein
MWGSRDIAPPLLTSALAGRKWLPLRPGPFTFWERAPGTCFIGGWENPRAPEPVWTLWSRAKCLDTRNPEIQSNDFSFRSLGCQLEQAS